MTDRNEALRLASWLKARQSHLGASRESCWDEERSCWDNYDKAAALLRQQAERIAELEKEGAELFGKVFSLGHELGQMEDQRDQLRAEVERMDFIEKEFGDVLLLELAKGLPRADMPFRAAIDHARTTHKDEG